MIKANTPNPLTCTLSLLEEEEKNIFSHQLVIELSTSKKLFSWKYSKRLLSHKACSPRPHVNIRRTDNGKATPIILVQTIFL